jgi:hypothetical protein
MGGKTLRQAVAVVATLLTGCSGRVPNECTFEIRLIDGGTTSGISGCGHKSPYDCTAELADGGSTAQWKGNCER